MKYVAAIKREDHLNTLKVSLPYSVYPRNKKGHGNFIKKGHFKRTLSDQKGHSKRALSDQKGR